MDADWMNAHSKVQRGHRNGIAIKFYSIATQIKMALNFVRLIEKFKLYAFAQLRLNLQIIDGFSWAFECIFDAQIFISVVFIMRWFGCFRHLNGSGKSRTHISAVWRFLCPIPEHLSLTHSHSCGKGRQLRTLERCNEKWTHANINWFYKHSQRMK